MDALRLSLMAKVKALNETLWERRAKEPAIVQWLDNFAESNGAAPDERLHALYLLSNFMYFGSRQIRELLKALYRDLYRYPIVAAIRQGNGDTVDSRIIDPLFLAELQSTRFLGVGKTHLMRYFSYPLQRIRHGSDVIGGIQNDKYIGIYLRCGGLNSARFRNKGQTDELWADVFAYYMELWLSQLVLSTIIGAVGGASELEDREPDVVRELVALINLRDRQAPTTLASLCALLRELQQELDDSVNNSAITRELPAHIAITRGNLIFGIPRAIAANLPSLRECLFLYLIDEFENLSAPQQKYVNTLLRERQAPCSFKIGGRMYGVRTHSTYSADEDNKEGSEFEVLPLDAMLYRNRNVPARPQ